jgi:hypothetical protein
MVIISARGILGYKITFRINEHGVKGGITEDQHARCIRSVGIFMEDLNENNNA